MDALGDPHHEPHVVLDEEHGEVEVVAHLRDERAELRDLLVVEAAGRLVEQQEPRLGRERARELDALQRPERQSGDRPARDIGDADVVEDLERTRVA